MARRLRILLAVWLSHLGCDAMRKNLSSLLTQSLGYGPAKPEYPYFKKIRLRGSAISEPDCADPEPIKKYWSAYCTANTTTKVYVRSSDCVRNFWWSNALDNERLALTRCEEDGKRCSVHDRNGHMCFECWNAHDASFTIGAAGWREYCRFRGKNKYWVTNEKCTSWGWGSSLELAHKYCKGTCMLLDYNGVHCPSEGPGDMRAPLQACLQYEVSWCWVTASIIISNYYNSAAMPVEGDNCHGLQCQVVGHVWGRDCCADRKACEDLGGTRVDMKRILNYFGGGRVFGALDRSLTNQELDRLLLGSNPVIAMVEWETGNFHVVVIGGTDGRGSYYIHDTMDVRSEGSFTVRTYPEIMRYEPGRGSYVGYTLEERSPVGYWKNTVSLCDSSVFFGSLWREYCAEAAPKAFAVNAACTWSAFYHGAEDSAGEATRKCAGDSSESCHVTDVDGARC